MALVSVAVFNKQNDLIYSKDFKEYQNLPASPMDDPFDLFQQHDQVPKKSNSGCSIRNEFIYYSAIDRLSNIFQMKRSANDNSMWIGLVLPVDELRVYGEIHM